MIEKIVSIKNFAIFKDFDWDSNVLLADGEIYNFRKLNILYGRNYSGKTSLSKIFRSFEKKILPHNYSNPKFTIRLDDSTIFNQDDINNHDLTICVYNKDFVRDNLKFLVNEDGEISPFAIMGEKNIEIEKKIDELSIELGDADKKQGLYYERENYLSLYQKSESDHISNEDQIKNQLCAKAKNIKENAAKYNNVNYRINNIESDIRYISDNNIQILNEIEISSYNKTLKEIEKPNIDNFYCPYPDLTELISKVKVNIEKEILPTKPIKDFLNDQKLQNWAKEGISLHKQKRNVCGFCFQTLPDNLWEIYNDHFNKESDKLVSELQKIKREIINNINSITNFKFIDTSKFYSSFMDELLVMKNKWELLNKEYIDILQLLQIKVDEKLDNIFKSINLTFEKDISILDSTQVILAINKLVRDHNKKKLTLNEDKKEASKKLRFNDVNQYIIDIDYYDQLKKIKELETEKISKKSSVSTIDAIIKNKENKIQELRNQMKDEKLAAEKINDYLGNYFGNNSLKLEYQDSEGELTFSIKRGDEKAYNLSEGECSLISFCYFMARLDDVSYQNKDMIIWIDDPISSLDNNHVFFVYSLIESRLAKNKEYEQLFISTHNIDFLKYLKKLTLPMIRFTSKKGTPVSEPHVGYYLIERYEKYSNIIVMPKYLRKYTTEFNYLFHQIKICSEMTTMDSNYESFYNFGNNLRKFLEAYLFYQYPNNTRIIVKLRKFCKGDDSATALINRVDNELSHLEDIFDRSIKPIDIPEIPKLAKYVLGKIEEHDKDQYDALVKSIKGK